MCKHGEKFKKLGSANVLNICTSIGIGMYAYVYSFYVGWIDSGKLQKEKGG